MSINVSQITNDFNKLTLENYEKAGAEVASNFSDAEDLLMRAYSGKDTESLAKELGLESTATTEQIQTVAQYKYEKASRIYSMFTKIMENAHQLLMNVINKIG